MKMISQHENLIFEMIQEYVSKNRTFDSREILPYLNSKVIKSKVNLNQSGIKHLIQKLIEKNMIIEGSTMTRKDVLGNINRDGIYQYIKKHPGTYFRKMVRDLKCSKSVIAWHVKILLDFNYIKSKTIDNREIFFNTNVDHENALFSYLKTNEKCKKIIDFFIERKQISKKKEIYDSIDMHHYTIKKYISILEEIDLLTKGIQGYTSIIRFNELKYRALMNPS